MKYGLAYDLAKFLYFSLIYNFLRFDFLKLDRK